MVLKFSQQRKHSQITEKYIQLTFNSKFLTTIFFKSLCPLKTETVHYGNLEWWHTFVFCAIIFNYALLLYYENILDI